MLHPTTQSKLRMLIYPIQFETNPVNGIDRVISMVIKDNPAYRTAIQSALASSDDLSSLIPQPHPDSVLRQYLQALQGRLQQSA